MMDANGYWLSQGARVAWYLSQYLVSTRVGGSRRPPAAKPPPPNLPTMRDLLVDLATLLRRDRANIAAGVYKMPHDAVPDLRRWIGDAALYFEDLPAVGSRRARGGSDEIGAEYERLPAYYRRNFHYQTDGYLSARSAALYDHQVEVLFLGGAAAMRRQALVPLAAYIHRRRGARLRLLDVGSGTADFLTFVKDNWPELSVTAVDLSRYYLAEAVRRLDRWGGAGAVAGAAEALPVADGAVDAATCIYLLHEVPASEREKIAHELSRVLKPGGRLIVVDSLQYGDVPAYDVLLERFPTSFHEPYYANYAAADLDALFAATGLRRTGRTIGFFSKVLVFDRPTRV
ncbi:MAG: class I SAM-dependent methyltransferase [Rhodospirillales bacterium]|jgi:ubiquinone/menaquinone biosynthesis C-methylase UbiE|nr:class I SAM-dependent methyltransferase [Rhodospirillales bacterium]